MLERSNQNLILSSLFGCMACLAMAFVVNADGRVFLLDLRNSSDLRGFGGAERACATQDARLASADELRRAVVECSFSSCTRGWLYGGAVGTTVCNNVDSALKAVDVRTENATENTANLDAFCIKDKGVPCGDPPSFPNTRLQGHTGFEMGDELLYMCVPRYVMPSGHNAFSLLCDSCGEWYGLVQICVKDETETHVDYEDKFTDAYREPTEEHIEEERPKEAHGEAHEEVHGAAYPDEQSSQEQQEVTFSVELGEEHQDQQGEQEARGEELSLEEEEEAQGYERKGVVIEGREEEDKRGIEDFPGHPGGEQEREEVARSDAAVATEAPVSLLSQKHLFWFPSEAFQEEGQPIPTRPITQTVNPEGETRVRASGGQSEESKEYDSQEGRYQHPADLGNHDDHDHHQDDQDDHDNSRHGDQDVYNDSHRDDQDDQDDHDDSHYVDQDDHDDSHHEDQDDQDNRDDHVKHYIPAQQDDLDKHSHYGDHDNDNDHYDMGEHEDGSDRVRYGSRGEYDDQGETYDEDHDQERYDDHDDVSDDQDDQDDEHPDGSEEHVRDDDHDDGEEHRHFDLERQGQDSDSYTDPDRYNDHDQDDRDDHDDHDNHDDHGVHQHVVFSVTTDEPQNITQQGAEGEPTATTDETWLDGYPVAPEETERGGSTEEEAGPEEEGLVVGVTDRPNEVEVSRPIPYTSLPEVPERPTREPDSEQDGVEKVWPGLFPTFSPSPVSPDPSDSISYPDTQDYHTHQGAPTHSWEEEPSEHPFLVHGPAPTMHGRDIISGTGGMKEEHTEHNLTGQAGERGEVEGEMGETTCTGEDCPPPPPTTSSRGPAVAATIVAVCAIAAAAVVGAWCYRRRQQKSSMYEANGKGQNQTRHGQQIEMQQKV